MKSKIYCILIMVITMIAITGCGDDNETIVVKPEIEKITEEAETIARVETEEVEEKASVEEPGKLDEDDYYINGAFCPREYALSLGFTLCDSTYQEDLLTIINGSTKYYVAIGEHCVKLYYEQDGHCFSIKLADNEVSHHEQTTLIGISEREKENSLSYLDNLKTLLATVATSKDIDPNAWSVPITMDVFDCSAKIKDNGFIDTSSFVNINKELSK